MARSTSASPSAGPPLPRFQRRGSCSGHMAGPAPSSSGPSRSLATIDEAISKLVKLADYSADEALEWANAHIGTHAQAATL
jgi:hypothetical protein